MNARSVLLFTAGAGFIFFFWGEGNKYNTNGKPNEEHIKMKRIPDYVRGSFKFKMNPAVSQSLLGFSILLFVGLVSFDAQVCWNVGVRNWNMTFACRH